MQTTDFVPPHSTEKKKATLHLILAELKLWMSVRYNQHLSQLGLRAQADGGILGSKSTPKSLLLHKDRLHIPNILKVWSTTYLRGKNHVYNAG